MANLIIPVILLIVFAGVLAFLIYSLLSYRKRNIMKFLIIMVLCINTVNCQNESSFEVDIENEDLLDFEQPIFEQEPTFIAPNYPGPIIIPDLDKACSIIEVTISSGLTSVDNSQVDESKLEYIWNQTLLALNNNSSLRNGNLTFIA